MKGGGEMKLRRWICFLLCLVLTVCLCAPALADGELFFVAVNDTIPLTLSVFPTYSGGTLYVPYQVFDSQPCGVTPSYNQAKQTYVLLSRTRQMIFDLAAGTVSDESGSVSTANVLYRGGILYLPLTFCASHFGLKTTMLESAGGYQILRFTDGSEVYDDSLFVEKAENLIAYRVRQSQSGSQSPERPTDRPNSGSQGTQEPSAAKKKPATVYLAFTGSETMRASMAALETYKLHGTFFLTEAEILADPSLVFELLAAGHSIGITAGEDDADLSGALTRANDALCALTCQKTLLALLPAEAEAPDSYCVFHAPSSPVSAADAAASETAHLLVCSENTEADLYTLFSAEARVLQLLENADRT